MYNVRPAAHAGPDHGAALRRDSLHPIVRLLVGTGTVSETEAATASVSDQSRSHTVVAIRTAHNDLVVKISTPSTRSTGRSLRNECFVHRLATWNPRVASAIAKARHVDEHAGILVMDRAPGRPCSELVFESGSRVGDAMEVLGAQLAQVHAATFDMTLPPASPPFAALLLTVDPSLLKSTYGPGPLRVFDVIGSSKSLRRVLERVRTQWHPTCLVHGDLKSDNIIVAFESGAVIVTITDWELAGTGCPSWDLGSMLGELLCVEAGTWNAVTPATLRLATSERSRAAERFLSSYRQMDGSIRLNAGDLADAVTTRAVQLAIECASGGSSGSARVAETALNYVRLAESMAVDSTLHDRFARELSARNSTQIGTEP